MSSKEIIFMYSGQGAQYYQMSRELWEHDPIYRAALKRYSSLVGMINGRELTEIIFSRPLSESMYFDNLIETHPLIVAVSLALTDTLAARGIFPNRVLGYSLGETISAVVSGALTPEEAMWAVQTQAAVFEKLVNPGCLVAVLSLTEMVTEAMPLYLRKRVHLAAVNAPAHYVYGMAKTDCSAFIQALNSHGLSHAVLPIRFAFHTPLIDSAQESFSEITEQLSFSSPNIPVHSCALSSEIHEFKPYHFWQVARNVVRFYDTIVPLADNYTTRFVDVGPSGTLAGFLRISNRHTDSSEQSKKVARPAIIIMNQFGHDIRTFNQAVERLV
ncbi:ptzK [Candidatus Endolissoclinum faulkneri L2]|uniref:PtzK n=1 Tax=Candidatus Endolissoclinum faulkneri L2 TaxID=1193729 RepID=K7YH11_9PROT|nr:acyltransferase domain-containing protein [Candidatus Endolissoclinum faulkneri]AFX98845.1 ptzK [Candidatus Endolissoclinum faulkneri L2]